MPWTDHNGPVPRRSPEDVRGSVRARAAAIRERRRRLLTATLSVAVFVSGVTVAMARAGDAPSGREVRSAAGGSASSVAEPTTAVTTGPRSTTSTTIPVPFSIPTTVTTRPPVPPTTTAATAPSVTTTTTSPCRNSIDPACGPFSWDPPPGPNQPLTLKVTFTPAAPRVGQEVTFRLVADDPDAIVSPCDNSDFGEPGGMHCVYGLCQLLYGPWTPAVKPGHRDVTYTHAYTAAGTFRATFSMNSLSCDDGKAYGSEASASVTVVVAP